MSEGWYYLESKGLYEAHSCFEVLVVSGWHFVMSRHSSSLLSSLLIVLSSTALCGVASNIRATLTRSPREELLWAFCRG